MKSCSVTDVKTYLLGVLALVGMMLWDVAQRWTQPPARQLAENSGMEGALDHAESAFFAPDGNRRYTLESVRLSYSTDENQAHSGRLRLVYDMPADKSMLLTAATGTVRDGGDTVTLGGTVVIQHWLSDTETVRNSTHARPDDRTFRCRRQEQMRVP